MDRPQPTRPEAAAIAAEWVAREDRGLSNREHAALRAWLAADPRHAEEHARARAAWRGLEHLGESRELSAMADDFLIRARQQRRRRRLVTLGGWSLGAAAAVLLGLFTWPQAGGRWDDAPPRFPTENYRVLASTARTERLPDGSTAELNGASRIAVDYTATARRVRLLEGEAHFVVASDAARPFYVTAGPVTVRAVGTAFNVRLASQQIEVLVTHGTVKLESAGADASVATDDPAGLAAQVEATPALVQGQRAVIPREKAADAGPPPVVIVAAVDRAAIDQELGWQTTRLVFNHTPLDEVVAGFNRYNKQRLTLGDPKLRQRALTGVFRADNVDGFVRLLRASVDVKAERRTHDEIVLLPVR